MQKDRKRLFGSMGAKVVDLLNNPTEGLDTLFHLHEQAFEERGKTTHFRQNERFQFHRNLIELLAPRDMVYLLGIEHEGRIVGASYGFRCGNRSVGYQLGYDLAYRKYGIGFQLVLNEVEWAIARRLVEHDLSTGGRAYKTAFTNEYRTVYTGDVALNRSGRQWLWLLRRYLQARQIVRRLLRSDGAAEQKN